MADVTITIRDEEVRRMLGQAPRRILSALRAGAEDGTVYLLRQMQTYPPPPARMAGTAFNPVRFTTRSGRNVSFMARRPEPYRRTNTLKRSWSRRVNVDRDGVIGIVGSNSHIAPYNRYVQDEALQARIHQGRWSTVQQIGRRSEARIRNMFNARLRAALG